MNAHTESAATGTAMKIARASHNHLRVDAVCWDVSSAVQCTGRLGTSQRNRKVAAKAPATWDPRNQGTSLGLMPAKVLEKARAIVTAGFAKDVDDVNQ
jgi:hypothetical protein